MVMQCSIIWAHCSDRTSLSSSLCPSCKSTIKVAQTSGLSDALDLLIGCICRLTGERHMGSFLGIGQQSSNALLPWPMCWLPATWFCSSFSGFANLPSLIHQSPQLWLSPVSYCCCFMSSLTPIYALRLSVLHYHCAFATALVSCWSDTVVCQCLEH